MKSNPRGSRLLLLFVVGLSGCDRIPQGPDADRIARELLLEAARRNAVLALSTETTP